MNLLKPHTSFAIASFDVQAVANAIAKARAEFNSKLTKEEYEALYKKESIKYESNSNLKFRDYVYFGKYNGDPILWRVIDFDKDGDPLLFSKYILDMMEYDSRRPTFNTKTFGYDNVAEWSNSDIRKWLNDNKDGFLSAENFTKDEFEKIEEVVQKEIVTGLDKSTIEGGIYPFTFSQDGPVDDFETVT